VILGEGTSLGLSFSKEGPSLMKPSSALSSLNLMLDASQYIISFWRSCSSTCLIASISLRVLIW